MIAESLNEFIRKSLFSGVLIGIAGYAYVSNPGVVGSVLFAIGLILVLLFNQNLYTGKIGYIQDDIKNYGWKCVNRYLLMLALNLIGAIVFAKLIHLYNDEKHWLSSYMSLEKTIVVSCNEYVSFFLRSFFCGGLMFCAVESYRKTKNVIGTIFCVSVFIICGYEHCIADAFYFAFGKDLIRFSPHLVLSIIGNTLGSISFRYLACAK